MFLKNLDFFCCESVGQFAESQSDEKSLADIGKTSLLNYLKDHKKQLDSRSLACLGLAFEMGWKGVENKPLIAFKAYERSAEQGNALGQYMLGKYHEFEKFDMFNVRDSKGGHEEALSLYLRSADQGNSYGQWRLGEFNQYGMGGIEKSPEKALRLYRLSANQSYSFGQYKLGKCYEKEIGVDKNIEEANRLYGLSALQGYKKAEKKVNKQGNCIIS